MKVKALKKIIYGGKTHEAGSTFEMEAVDFNVQKSLGSVTLFVENNPKNKPNTETTENPVFGDKKGDQNNGK